MTDKNTLSTLKAQWVILKDESAAIKDKVAAYKMIDLIQEQHKDEEGFSVVPLQNTRYKIYESIERATSSQKEAPTAKTTNVVNMVESAPAKQVSSVSFQELLQNFEFKELTDKEQESTEKKARAFFEAKVIAAKVALEEQFKGLGFENVQSVGQCAGSIREN